MPGFTAADVPDQTGKTFVVTGGNTGLGFEAAKVLASKGAEVILACRSEERARSAIARIVADHPDAKLDFVELDQADLFSVRRAAEALSARSKIDVLVNNAGVMMVPLSHTAQGYEMQFGVNHLGTFALTSLLLPKLAADGGGRVVVTSSIAHRSGEAIWSDPKAEESYSRMQRYYDSKLANALFFIELDRRLRADGSPVAAIGCHPGIASTELGRHFGPAKFMMPLVGKLLNSARQGAWPTLQAATDPSAESGDYFGPRGLREMSGPSGPAFLTRLARDPGAAEWLWKRSVELTDIDPDLAGA
ncbi:oxidoreductase [Croceicoccus naphthovorans]|uniref:Oxidoreductase n=1 Tax=Croceicoccus naphthovorans TaxID=1348774 RepID=A0A0G3XHU0_9SPHN|nr:oxidoreductase [Croceicoccus naphthovorans]AKM10181.1 oxidoreductase [Croceicoccus naphthovorans]MBB3990581.1 NAD(P)-dependent dehydrogenase (short-subunit alcohol dehydrogenase family) [Croceicoccus naphthovorans]